jgi:hypothetical protein
MNKNKNFFIALFLLVFLGGMLVSISETNAQGFNYQLLEKIPGKEAIGGNDLSKYITAIYDTALVIVVLSAVLMASIGGFMYLTSAGNTAAMGTAKGVIFDAVIGLVIALAAWLLLNVINPDLVNVTIKSLSVISAPGVPPTGPPPAPGTGTGCGGYSTNGISSGQCNDAAQPLSDILNCMYGKYPNTQITSISDDAGFDTCKNNWNDPACAHAQNSCHYGGGASQTSSECQKSLAADFSIRNGSGQIDLSKQQAVSSAASSCGGRVNNENNHVHVSAQASCCSL